MDSNVSGDDSSHYMPDFELGSGVGPEIVFESGRTAAQWPMGHWSAVHEDLAKTILQAASFHASVAIDSYTSDSHQGQLTAAISVGCAVELVVKASIALIEPTLLADRVDRETLLRLAGHHSRARKEPTEIKTVGAANALLLAKELLPNFRYNQIADEIVLRVRKLFCAPWYCERARVAPSGSHHGANH